MYVFRDGIPFAFVANDVLVIIALQNLDVCGIANLVNLFSAFKFEISNQLSQCPFFGRGDWARYIGDDNDSVYMIGHHDKFA